MWQAHRQESIWTPYIFLRAPNCKCGRSALLQVYITKGANTGLSSIALLYNALNQNVWQKCWLPFWGMDSLMMQINPRVNLGWGVINHIEKPNSILESVHFIWIHFKIFAFEWVSNLYLHVQCCLSKSVSCRNQISHRFTPAKSQIWEESRVCALKYFRACHRFLLFHFVCFNSHGRYFVILWQLTYF